MEGPWLASYIALWVIVALQGVAIFLLLRQLGIMYLGTAQGVARDGIAPGTTAPDFALPSRRRASTARPSRCAAMRGTSGACSSSARATATPAAASSPSSTSSPPSCAIRSTSSSSAAAARARPAPSPSRPPSPSPSPRTRRGAVRQVQGPRHPLRLRHRRRRRRALQGPLQQPPAPRRPLGPGPQTRRRRIAQSQQERRARTRTRTRADRRPLGSMRSGRPLCPLSARAQADRD